MKNKINVIDVILILLVIIAILFAAVKFFKIGNKVSPEHYVDAVYTVRIVGLKDVSMELIPDSGELKDGDGTAMGKVLSKNVEVAKEINQLADGSYKKIENKEKFDVYLEISCRGLQKDDGFYFDGLKNYGVNSNVYFDTDAVSFEGRIEKLTVKE